MEQIAFCAAFQHVRSPTDRRDVSATYARTIEELGRVAFANVERAEAVLNRYARDTGESVEVSAQSMVEAIQGKHIEFVATEIPFLRNMMEQAQTLSQLMMKLDWEILIAASGTGFLICDSPFVIVPPQGSAEVGLLVPGAVKYFPADPWSVPAARAARTGAPQSKPMASSTGWSTTPTALRCAATRCARIAGSRTQRALTKRDR